jgi:Flp pilus assembly protein TadG
MRRRERGSLTVEIVVLTPVVLLFVLLALSFGRFELAHQQVVGAAQAAAQAASVVSDPAEATAAALRVAQPDVANDLHACQRLTVTTNTTHFAPGGFVVVVVTCQINYSDLLIPGVPGRAVVQASERAPIDPFRSVQ